MKLLEFIFQSFWTFAGFALLLMILFAGISDIIKEIKKKVQ